MVSQHYWPEHFQITEICEELVRRGHQVTALVGIPNYPKGVVPEEYLHGKNRQQIRNGVNIIRVEEISRKPGIRGLAKNYISYMREADKKIGKLPGDFDVIFAYQLSPVLMSEPAMRMKKRTGIPVFLYCADIWPDAIKAMLPDKLNFAMPLIKAMSSKIYRQANVSATNASSYVDYFDQEFGISRDKVFYLPQYAEDSYLDMDLTARPSDKVRFLIMGNIGKLQYMPCVLEAVNSLKHRDDFELHIVGDGSAMPYCKQYVAEHELQKHVVFHGRRPYEEMPNYYRNADCCLLTLNVPGAPGINSTLPSRLQGFMAAGKPILASIDGSAVQVINDSGCGKAVPAGDAEGLAKLMRDFLDNSDSYASCGANGRTYYKANFTKQRFMNEIEKLLVLTMKGAQ